MIDYDAYYDDTLDELRAEARIERQQRRQATQCQCDIEFGTCPGPANCPCAGDDEEEGDD